MADRVYILTLQPSGRTIELPLGRSILVGRDPRADVIIASSLVSRQHTRFTALEHGLHVRDLGSTNGTIVGSARVTDVLLTDGEPVAMGDVVVMWTMRAPSVDPLADAEGATAVAPRPAAALAAPLAAAPARAASTEAIVRRCETLLQCALALRGTAHYAPLKEMARLTILDPDPARQAARCEILTHAIAARLHAAAHGAAYLEPDEDRVRWAVLNAAAGFPVEEPRRNFARTPGRVPVGRGRVQHR